MGKQVLSFLFVKMIWISHNFFGLLAKFCVIFPLYWTKNLGFRLPIVKTFSFFKMLFILGWFCCDLFLRDYFIQRLINKTGGPLRWVLIFSPDLLIFLRATSKDCQSLVALKILCTVPWITFFLCCDVAQLRKFTIMRVSVDFWYQWQLILS